MLVIVRLVAVAIAAAGEGRVGVGGKDQHEYKRSKLKTHLFSPDNLNGRF